MKIEKGTQKPTLKTCTGYLSVSTSEHDGIRRWRVMGRGNLPLCADTPDQQRALAVALQVFGQVVLAVWDGDLGEFIETYIEV